MPKTHHKQANPTTKQAVLSGLGAMIGISLLGLGHQYQSDFLLLMAPFGASSVLLYAVSSSPLAQPRNIIFSHLIATAVALLLLLLLKEISVLGATTPWWAIGLAVGLTITLCAMVKVTHPPAGATAIVVMITEPDFMFILFPVLSGSIILVVSAILYHRFVTGNIYPSK